MKVILRDHVEHLGERGQIVNVAVGYARNYLVPKGLALEATPGNLKQVEHQRRTWQLKEARELAEFQALAERLGALALSVTHKAGESGTLYGAVTNVELAELLSQRGFAVDRRRIVLDEPIKTVGSHQVRIKLHPKVSCAVTLDVVAEGSSE